MSFFRRGIHILPERWEKAVSSDGQYLNWNVFVSYILSKVLLCKKQRNLFKDPLYTQSNRLKLLQFQWKLRARSVDIPFNWKLFVSPRGRSNHSIKLNATNRIISVLLYPLHFTSTPSCVPKHIIYNTFPLAYYLSLFCELSARLWESYTGDGEWMEIGTGYF